jgi:hypothetical protein
MLFTLQASRNATPDKGDLGFSDPFSLQSKQLQPDYVSSYNYSISQLLTSWFLPSPP